MSFENFRNSVNFPCYKRCLQATLSTTRAFLNSIPDKLTIVKDTFCYGKDTAGMYFENSRNWLIPLPSTLTNILGWEKSRVSVREITVATFSVLLLYTLSNVAIIILKKTGRRVSSIRFKKIDSKFIEMIRNATDNEYSYITETIKKRKLDINQRCPEVEGLSIFLAACVSGHHKTILFMLNNGADIWSTTPRGDSGLYLATHAILVTPDPNIIILRDLLDAGCSINACNNNGFTALHRCAMSGNQSVIKWLLDNGADPSLTNAKGILPCDSAYIYGHIESAELLRSVLSSKTPSLSHRMSASGDVVPKIKPRRRSEITNRRGYSQPMSSGL